MAVALEPRRYAAERVPAELGGGWADPFDASCELATNPRLLIDPDTWDIFALWRQCVRFNAFNGMPDGYSIYPEPGGLLDQPAYPLDCFDELSRACATLLAQQRPKARRGQES